LVWATRRPDQPIQPLVVPNILGMWLRIGCTYIGASFQEVSMFPWLFFFAPQWQLPFSGSVAQRIDPQTHWFFDGIDASAGDGRIERQAFEVATYGRQLGLLTEVLVDLAEQVAPQSEAARKSLKRLKAIQVEIEKIKAQDAATLVRDVEQALDRLQKQHPAAYERLGERMQLRLPRPE